MRFIAILFFCFIVCSAGVFAQAQKGDAEVFAAVGRFTMADFVLSLANRDEDRKSSVFPPIYMAGWRRYVTDKFALGAIIGQHSFATSGHNRYNAYSYSEYFDGVFACIELKRLYLNTRTVQLYTTVAAGVTYMKGKHIQISDDYNSQPKIRNVSPWIPALYYSPIGIRVGRDRLGIFAEVGLGTRGLYNGGLTYTLNRSPKKW